MYVFWDPEKIKRAIILMEEQFTTGASQIGTPTEGSMTLQSPRRAEITLERLYRAYEKKTGTKLDRDRVRHQIKTFQITVDPQENFR